MNRKVSIRLDEELYKKLKEKCEVSFLPLEKNIVLSSKKGYI